MGGVQSAGVSQRVRVTGRDESQSVPSPEKKLFNTRDLELPFFEGSLPSCSPHSAGYTRTFVHPYFPVAKQDKNARTSYRQEHSGAVLPHLPCEIFRASCSRFYSISSAFS